MQQYSREIPSPILDKGKCVTREEVAISTVQAFIAMATDPWAKYDIPSNIKNMSSVSKNYYLKKVVLPYLEGRQSIYKSDMLFYESLIQDLEDLHLPSIVEHKKCLDTAKREFESYSSLIGRLKNFKF